MGKQQTKNATTIATGIKGVRQVIDYGSYNPVGKYTVYLESGGRKLVKTSSTGYEDIIHETFDLGTISCKEDFWKIEELLKYIPSGKTLYIYTGDADPLSEYPENDSDNFDNEEYEETKKIFGL